MFFSACITGGFWHSHWPSLGDIPATNRGVSCYTFYSHSHLVYFAGREYSQFPYPGAVPVGRDL